MIIVSKNRYMMLHHNYDRALHTQWGDFFLKEYLTENIYIANLKLEKVVHMYCEQIVWYSVNCILYNWKCGAQKILIFLQKYFGPNVLHNGKPMYSECNF